MTFQAKQNVIIRNCYALPSMASAFQDQIRESMEIELGLRNPPIMVADEPEGLPKAHTAILSAFWSSKRGAYLEMTAADISVRSKIEVAIVPRILGPMRRWGWVTATMNSNHSIMFWQITPLGIEKLTAQERIKV